jgi:polyhydroxyalkanoate synthesis regulator phasin
MLKKLLAALCLCVKSKTMSQPEPPSPFSDPTPTELEMILDATNIAEKGRPLARTPGQGIADMDARIELLTRQIQQVKDQLKSKPAEAEFQASAKPFLDDLIRDLGGAQDRLHEYQTQQQGLN